MNRKSLKDRRFSFEIGSNSEISIQPEDNKEHTNTKKKEAQAI